MPFCRQKYVRTGNDLNCLQRDLSYYYPSKRKPTKVKKRFAYAWYVSRVEYHCAALVSLKMIKNLRMKGCELLWDFSHTVYTCFLAIGMFQFAMIRFDN